MKKLVIVSTSHVARESVERVKKAIEEEKPDVVAVELDVRRLQGLFAKQTRLPFSVIRLVGIRGYIFLAVGRFVQQRIGKWVGVVPGSEMKAAVIAARKSGAKIALIDQDIGITVRRLTAALSWREKWTFIKSIFLGLVGKGNAIELGKLDLSKVPPAKLIKEVMKYLKKDYPNIYRVLVEERNEVMARNLVSIMKTDVKKIVAVVGAGHEEGLVQKVKELSEGFKKPKKE
ncbi:TraB/GumN family protein [Candidatus Woesearchaeota archaeon]|nr:TraB/GumN family protein [Candidatus Woesearchaeota archaeon]